METVADDTVERQAGEAAGHPKDRCMTLLNGIVGKETYLQGKYLAVGLNGSGTIGTTKNVLPEFNTDLAAGYKRLGLVGDTDGFGTGKAATHDAVVRGLCIEGFNIGYKTGGATYVRSNQELAGLSQINGTASNASTKTVAEADWKGATTEKLAVDQKVTLTDDAKFLRFEVTLTNNSAASMADLRYLRTVDPDLADGFSTVNTIVKQGAGGALVTAAAKAGADPMFLYSNDTRAVVTTGGFINQDPYASSVTTAQAVGTTTKTDVSMSINFDLGSLAAGKSTTVVFYMGITDNLTATIAEIDKLPGGVVTAPSNAAPVAVADSVTIVAGDLGKGNVLLNDKDANGDALTAKLDKGPSHGAVTLSADGSYIYKADAGYVGNDSFTYVASDGKASSSSTVSVTVKAPTPTVPANTAPAAAADSVAIVAGEVGRGNVLLNDKDANGDVLTAKLDKGPGHGVVTLSADGNYIYKADAGYVGNDSFTYLASDGKATAAATVSVTVKAPQPTFPSLPVSPLLQRAGTVNGSASTNDTLTGVSQHNSFYFDLAAKSGADKIANFGSSDILVTKGVLYDGNGDGLITFSRSKLSLDGAGSADSVTLSGVSALRFLGTEDGLSVYANGALKPKGVIEGKIGDDVFKGDVADSKKNVFFFDSALDIHLGDDRIDNFGAKDLLVTTSAISTKALGASGVVKLVGADSLPGEAGTVELHGLNGAAVQALDFDGSVNHNGSTYYVYSLHGSSAGLADLSF
jgi:VCBS repeat-containing protein